MKIGAKLRSVWNTTLDIGEYPEESNVHRGRRRIVVGYMVIGFLPRIGAAAQGFDAGQTAVAWIDIAAAFIPLVGLVVLWRRPSWYEGIVHVLLLAVILENLIPTILLGGMSSTMLIAFSFVVVVGALIALDRRAAFWWFIIYIANVVLAVVLPQSIEPLYEVEGTDADTAFMLISTAILLYAGMAYFVRQRDQFQQESDELLHNILPDTIATQLKAERTMIADDYAEASVLFADVVGFTPMSADMSPQELVGLLNEVFSVFDELVTDLGLEKIKTVGDEYMVAAGVPTPMPNHAMAIATLGLRMRDHVATNRFAGHQIQLRIGINSGPVVAGIVGTHKFAYDLWGDVVNTASRMESEGVPGQIQITEATYNLIRDDFTCESRGEIPIKGKSPMRTYFITAPATVGR